MSGLISITALLLLALDAPGGTQQSRGHGPEVKAFLSLMKQEEDELDFQLRRKEMSRAEYTRSKNRIAVHRKAVLDYVGQAGGDRVPEFQIVTASEVGLLISEGAEVLKGIKAGDVIKNKWRYIGRVLRGEEFHIFERIREN